MRRQIIQQGATSWIIQAPPLTGGLNNDVIDLTDLVGNGAVEIRLRRKVQGAEVQVLAGHIVTPTEGLMGHTITDPDLLEEGEYEIQGRFTGGAGFEGIDWWTAVDVLTVRPNLA